MASEKIIKPHKGPQTLFLSTPADIAIYGGAAGGGKSHAMLMEPLRHYQVKGFDCVTFRKERTDITKSGGLWGASFDMYRVFNARPNKTELRWRFPSGASVGFAGLRYDDDVYAWQSAELALIQFDELTHFSEARFFYLLSRNRSTCGVRPYVRAATNPDPDHWLRGFLAWWIDEKTGYPIPERDGVIRWMSRQNDEIIWSDEPKEGFLSVTFIAAKLADNPTLCESDPEYVNRLEALPAHERARLKGGNWNVRAMQGDYFKRHWFEIVDAAPKGPAVRYWDLASTKPGPGDTDPDWLVGCRLVSAGGGWCVDDVVRDRVTPEGVKRIMRVTASREPHVTQIIEQEPGSGGKAWAQTLASHLQDFPVRVSRPMEAKEIRAVPLSSQCEIGNVSILRARWNDVFLDELEAFPRGGHDDQVDAFVGAWQHSRLRGAAPRVRYT